MRSVSVDATHYGRDKPTLLGFGDDGAVEAGVCTYDDAYGVNTT